MKIQKKILIKCRNGHWFAGSACPIDGYFDDFVDQVLKAEEIIRTQGEEVTLDALRKQGDLAVAALSARLVVVELTENIAEDQFFCLLERME